MKNNRTLAWLLAFSVMSPVLSRADAPLPPAGAPQAAPADEKKTDLEVRMDKMGKAVRKLKKQVADPAQNASSLELVATMLGAAKEAEEFTPEKAADLPVDQRGKFIDDFKAGLKDLEGRFGKLQDALTAGKNADASAILGDIIDFEKKSHKEFKKPKAD